MLTFKKDLSQFNYKKFSPEDRLRIRELRFEIRKLWYPPRDPEIKAWRRKAGINSATGVREFARLSREEKTAFFEKARKFIEEIERQSATYYREISKKARASGEDPFGILDVSPESDLEIIKKQYRRLVLKHHPDHGGNPEDFIRINEAYRKIIRMRNCIK